MNGWMDGWVNDTKTKCLFALYRFLLNFHQHKVRNGPRRALKTRECSLCLFTPREPVTLRRQRGELGMGKRHCSLLSCNEQFMPGARSHYVKLGLFLGERRSQDRLPLQLGIATHSFGRNLVWFSGWPKGH